MNACHFIGRLAKDPETKKSASGLVYTLFDVAVQKNKARDASFIHFIAYNNVSAVVNKICHKGDKVAVTGYLEPSKAVSKEGLKYERYVIVAETVELLAKAKEKDPTDDGAK